jgi:single-stranded-DNA-specific exonuclease
MASEWHICSQESDQVSELAKALNCHRAVAASLINRGFSQFDRAQAFLNPSFDQLRSPFLMKDMDTAVSRIIRAIQQREKVFVFGDYDVDGVTATTLLLDFFSHLDLDVSYHVPDRLTEGYGLSPEAIERHVIPCKAALIITVDCGTSSHEAIRLANRLGIDVIITDHHKVPPSLPEALAILNPKRNDCPSRFANLAGVGVAFNLVLALRKHLRDVHFWNGKQEPNLKNVCDLVALGTVADMVPLLDENRLFVRAGLDVMATSPRPGLKALIRVSGASDRPLDTWDLAFRLAPRLNAAGRLGLGARACELLMTSSHEMAASTSKELDKKNDKRKDIETQILTDIAQRLEDCPELLERSLVLESHTWHEGVIGIVASRLVTQHRRPVVLIALRDGSGKGSARAPKGFDLFRAIDACSQHLEKFGGHEAAAGLSLKPDSIAGFRHDFETYVRNNTNVEDFAPRLRIDMQIAPQEISPELANDIERLAPFGSGNPEPLFLISDMDVISAHHVGESHLKMQLIPTNDRTLSPLNAIFFNAPFSGRPPKRFRQIACNLRWNRWKNTKRLQVVVKDFISA